ncbi:hypothetical protein Cylst_3614 [Cylindrospermum stagnale PCC 7417]|uniref:Uncharacterized protein n=1 Tax=Cylindrospermum stagnale PCC 7417 TaxID=56107 RepID=K9WZV9_9NOST|nr:hypothetical protein [Cylindrospermum stagnale]AFZ25748.1 hypothetical protein Cylst_3614 [Cylindrospermum stagnale PCC 7417]
MTNKINSSDTFPALSSPLDLELLEALLEPDDATYPWNPADEESEAYFYQLEQQFTLPDWLEAELTTSSQDFYHHLDTLWSEITVCDNHTTEQTVADHLQENLYGVFAASVPQIWLKAIAQKASEIFASQQSTGEQLVECVQAVLPNWGVEDLLVLARPFAYSMRGSRQQSVVSVINNVGNRNWTGLSEIEQAKVSLAIAHYALIELNNKQKTEA